MNRIITPLVFVVVIFGAAASMRAATFNVTTTIDSQDANTADGLCLDASGLCSLRAAITQANALAGDDIINLPAGTYTQTLAGAAENNNAGGDWDINAGVTINGVDADTTIVQAAVTPGTATERVFHLRFTAGMVVNINTLTVRHGRNTGNVFGAGIRLDLAAGTLNLDNAIVEDNRNSSNGGGIAVSSAAGSTLNITNGVIRNNIAGSSTAGTTGSGGGIFFNNAGILIVDGSFVTGNSASSTVSNTFGGGIFSVGTATITDTAIANNVSMSTAGQAIGGGFYTNTAATLANVDITGNSSTSSAADAFGGGFTLLTGGNMTVTDSSLSNNSATSTFANGFGLGAGFYNQNATLTIQASVAGSRPGYPITAPALEFGKKELFGESSSVPTVAGRSEILDNSASHGQGAGRTLGVSGNAVTNIINTTISNNSSVTEAGGLGNLNGGNFSATTTITGSTINGNESTGPTSIGGGLLNFSAGNGTATLILLDSTVSNNSAFQGAGIYNGRNTGTAIINVDYSTITENLSGGTGGGAFVLSGTLNTKDSIFANNAPTDFFGVVTSGGYNHIENPGVPFTSTTGDVTGTDPQLGPLGFNGGPTATHRPLSGSPVLDTIPFATNGCGTTVTTDQRGLERPSGPACDKGAVELGPGPPTITAIPQTLIQGSEMNAQHIANLTVEQGTVQDVVVTVEPPNPANGVLLTAISNVVGTVVGDFQVGCMAESTTFTLQATQGSLSGTDTLKVTIQPNTPPNIVYGNQSVPLNGSVSFSPTASDNGTIEYQVLSIGTYTGGISLEPNGRVNITNAGPAGSHTITIRATDNCMAVTDATFTLDVIESPTEVQFLLGLYNVDESQQTAVSVFRSGDLSGTTTVRLKSTLNGSAVPGALCPGGIGSPDYVPLDQILTFMPGSAEPVTPPMLQSCGDPFDEDPESVELQLSDATGAVITSPTTLLIINDTANEFVNDDPVTINEGGLADSYPITLSVSGAPTTIDGMRITLFGMLLNNPQDTEILVVAPNGANMVLQSGAGGTQRWGDYASTTYQDGALQVLLQDAVWATGKYEPTTWRTRMGNFPFPAPTAPYPHPGSDVGGTPSLSSVFGGTNPNGNWKIYVCEGCDGGSTAGRPSGGVGEIAGGVGLQFFAAPSTAAVSLAGRVTRADGAGISKARLTITGGDLTGPRLALTNGFGYYRFPDLTAGATYIVSVGSKQFTFTFPSRVVLLTGDVTNIDFAADP